MDSQDISSLFLSPRSVVFIGVPRKSGPGALNPVDNLRNWGYEGVIHLVHPHVREIAGLPVLPSVSELDGPVDLAVISAPRQTIPGIIRECGEKGIRAIIVTNQGFAEADPIGKELHREMFEAARAFGIRILGPNTLGVSNAFHCFNTSFMPLEQDKAPIGLVCQSGLFFVAGSHVIGGAGVAVDVGNAGDIDIVDALEWLGRDERLKVIALHAEEIPGRNGFIERIEKVSRRIPIVALKTGRSKDGARAAASHSGSMAGEDRIVDAALRKTGIIRVDETEDLADLVRGFVRLPRIKGPRIAVITVTGGGGIILMDTMERYGLQLAQLSPGTLDGILGLSPDWMPLANPIDVWPAVMKNGMRKAYGTVLEDVLRDPNVDAVLCIALGLHEAEQAHLGTEEVIQELSEKFDKPIVVWLYGSEPQEAARRLEKHGRALAVLNPERAVRLLAAMFRYGNGNGNGNQSR